MSKKSIAPNEELAYDAVRLFVENVLAPNVQDRARILDFWAGNPKTQKVETLIDSWIEAVFCAEIICDRFDVGDFTSNYGIWPVRIDTVICYPLSNREILLKVYIAARIDDE